MDLDQSSLWAGARVQCRLGPGLSVDWDQGSVWGRGKSLWYGLREVARFAYGHTVSSRDAGGDPICMIQVPVLVPCLLGVELGADAWSPEHRSSHPLSSTF